MLNYNGTLYPDNAPILTAQNRAFRYGDGVWETMRCIDGELPFYAYHVARMTQALHYLHLNLPDFAALRQSIKQTLEGQTAARVRLALFRADDTGALTPETDALHFLIAVSPLPTPTFAFAPPLRVGISREARLPRHIDPCYAHLKLPDSLPYIRAAREAKINDWHEALLCNTEQNVVEASSSNVLVLHQGTLYLTDPQQYGLRGTMQTILQAVLAPQIGIATDYWSFHKDLLFEADEIMLTNAVQGIRAVAQIAGIDKRFGSEVAQALHQQLLLKAAAQ